MTMYRVIAEWKMYGVHYVEADSPEEAVEKTYGNDVPLPDEQHYMDGSFEIDPDEVEEVEYLVHGGKARR